MEVSCNNCGIYFYTFPSNIKKNKNNFCSQKCHYSFVSKDRLLNCMDCNVDLDPNRKNLYKSVCKNCYNKNLLKKYPDKLEKKRMQCRSYLRKKKGLPIDTPLMKAKNGEGSYCQGYKTFTRKDHPNSDKDGKISEHVLVMSKYLGRPMRKGETIHHKNGIRDDNRLENLELWDKRHPPGQRVLDKVKFYKEFIALYENEMDKLNSIGNQIHTNKTAVTSAKTCCSDSDKQICHSECYFG